MAHDPEPLEHTASGAAVESCPWHMLYTCGQGPASEKACVETYHNLIRKCGKTIAATILSRYGQTNSFGVSASTYCHFFVTLCKK